MPESLVLVFSCAKVFFLVYLLFAAVKDQSLASYLLFKFLFQQGRQSEHTICGILNMH